MDLTTYLHKAGFTNFEGYSGQISSQTADLKALAGSPVVSIMEIGFNAGHSSDSFLSANPNSVVTAFDLGGHNYVKKAKEYIDMKYPGRHTLVLGDSTKTIPSYIAENKGKVFDLIFIDGGHDYHIAKADLHNCFSLSHKNTTVIMDDTTYTKGFEASYTIGPTRAWKEGISDGHITEIGWKEYSHGRGMSWGKYTH
jgi:predicted O-methyltransferase YrrM